MKPKTEIGGISPELQDWARNYLSKDDIKLIADSARVKPEYVLKIINRESRTTKTKNSKGKVKAYINIFYNKAVEVSLIKLVKKRRNQRVIYDQKKDSEIKSLK